MSNTESNIVDTASADAGDEHKKHPIVQRTEMMDAVLTLGSVKIPLAEYATTGLLALGVGPRGCGKTNVGQVMAEQLSEQGWVAVLFDPEGQMELMYGDAVRTPAELLERLTKRDKPIVVVRATDAEQFVPFGRVVLQVADDLRKPLLVVIDEGQVFSAARKRSEYLGEAADIINEFADRGRKRAVDVYMTTLRQTGSIHRSLFSNANLTLIGCQNDAAGWAALSPQFKSAGITFGDLNSLAPSEFFCINRRGIEKVKMQMSVALAKVAPASVPVRRNLPATFSQWDRAMREMPDQRLEALTPPVVALLASIAGLSAKQKQVGQDALVDELSIRA